MTEAALKFSRKWIKNAIYGSRILWNKRIQTSYLPYTINKNKLQRKKNVLKKKAKCEISDKIIGD